jgi:hypothetical protein
MADQMYTYEETYGIMNTALSQMVLHSNPVEYLKDKYEAKLFKYHFEQEYGYPTITFKVGNTNSIFDTVYICYNRARDTYDIKFSKSNNYHNPVTPYQLDDVYCNMLNGLFMEYFPQDKQNVVQEFLGEMIEDVLGYDDDEDDEDDEDCDNVIVAIIDAMLS